MSRGGRPAKARPTGYTLLGLYLGLRAAGGLLLALGVRLDYSDNHGPDGFPLLVAVFAAVATEALWSCRPWVLRATVAYFCASTLAPLAASALDRGLMPGEAVASIIAKLVIVALPLMYVHRRAEQLFPRPAPAPALPPQPQP
ncbi:MAG: hypothetical protein ACJ8J0_21260 [Longimicrobiaceae bacterium]